MLTCKSLDSVRSTRLACFETTSIYEPRLLVPEGGLETECIPNLCPLSFSTYDKGGGNECICMSGYIIGTWQSLAMEEANRVIPTI
jgi:hypothetical protein